VSSSTKKKTLLIVVGTQPQVITLAFHHLAFAHPEPFLANEVVVITTGEGRNILVPMLLDKEHGYFVRLLREYGIKKSEVLFDESCVKLIRGNNQTPLFDISTDEDNQHAANQISEVIRELTLDADRELHVCLADGRKPMSFYAGYALSLFGRDQDRLSQIIVNDELSGHPEFFYPPKNHRHLLLEDTDAVFNTAEAHVVMGNVPFVRLRDHLPVDLLENLSNSFALGEVVNKTQRNLAAVQLTIDCRAEQILINQEPLKLQPKPLAFLWWLALRRKRLGERSHSINSRDKSIDFDLFYAELDGAVIREESKPDDEFDPQEISQLISKIRKSIERQFGKRMLERFGDFKEGEYGQGSYGLFDVSANQIDILNDLAGNGQPCKHLIP